MSRDFCENFQKSEKPRDDESKNASKKGVSALSAASQVAGDGSAEQKFSDRQSDRGEDNFEADWAAAADQPQTQKPPCGTEVFGQTEQSRRARGEDNFEAD